MPEDVNRTAERVTTLLSPGVRANLIPKGLARGIIWEDGKLPPGSPRYSPELSDELLDYGYTLLRLALLLRENGGDTELAGNAFERAAEAIEAVVRNGDPEDSERGFHRVAAACSYHLAHFSARSYTLLPSAANFNLASVERGVTYLLRRSLTDLRDYCSEWLLDPSHSDGQMAERLSDEAAELGFDEILQMGLASTFLRGLSLFDFALMTGNDAIVEQARATLADCEEAASESALITAWWTSKLAKNLIDDLWDQSLHQQIPSDIQGGNVARWPVLRRLLISVLQSRRVAEIELWPSQIEAAKRVSDAADDLVVSLPTSAGKTRIAELCILRTLAEDRRVIYVTPLRALSAQVERDLRETFQPLGFSVSSLYGASGQVGLDTDTLVNREIVVATPEKLDFALRQDSSLLDDIGLIVLDEAHTIGPKEREVRYEVLVQRLLKRPDAALRRLVCLSAILPKGEELDDFVSWIRQGEPGAPVVADWRPTRQRFGTIMWTGDHARLDLDVEDEKSFVPRFVTAVKVPKARTRVFPKDGAELTLASAWRIAKEGRSALIFCPQRNYVESLARKIIDLHTRGVLERLTEDSPDLLRAKRVGAEWLGSEHPAVLVLDIGVAVHHAGLPKAFLREIEGLLRSRKLPVTISSPTLAQGLNLSASALLMYSIRRGGNVIQGEEFGNIIGRAGRARVDIDGQILYVLYEPTSYRLREWWRLVASARQRRIQSGLFALIALTLDRLRSAFGLNTEELLEYVAGNSEAWDAAFTEETTNNPEIPASSEILASLDSALLALVERLDCEPDELPNLLDDILADSLWVRTLAHRSDEEKGFQQRVLILRAEHIWNNSTAGQRKGYFASGVSFRTGQQLDTNAEQLNQLLFRAEQAIENDDGETAIEAATVMAEIIFEIVPFTPRAVPNQWKEVIRGWLLGQSMAEIVQDSPEELVEFVEGALVYRLVWGVEAIRVRSQAHQDEFAELWTGKLAEALEAGTMNRSAVILIHAGLGSRVAALTALSEYPADFKDYAGMRDWLDSDSVAEASENESWPTEETAELWRRFIESLHGVSIREWKIQRKVRAVSWSNPKPPSQGQFVRIVHSSTGLKAEVRSPDFILLGELKVPLQKLPGIMWGTVGPAGNEIEVTYHGPSELK